MPAAQALNTIRSAPRIGLGIQQLDEGLRNQLGLNPAMDLQAVVVVLTTKVGYGPLDKAYRLVTKRTLMQDFRAQLTALDASRAGMRMNAAQQAGMIDALIDGHDRSAWLVGNQLVDNLAKTDNLIPNLLQGTTRQLGKPVISIPGPVGKLLNAVRGAVPFGNMEVDRYDVITDPKLIEALMDELRAAKASGQLPQVLAAYQQQTGRSLYTTLGEMIRDANVRQKLLALLPPPINEKQLTYDAFLENVAIGMAYENASGDALEGKAPDGEADHQDLRRGGQFAALLAYFGYQAQDVVVGKWGLEMRILTPIPGKAKYKDVIVTWRGTEGVAFNLDSNKPGTVDTKIGDFAPGSIGYYQIMQNKEVIDHQLNKARAHGPLLMVGHSLGGGLAQLAATMYAPLTRTVVTFQGANIDQKDIDRLLKYNQLNPALAITARHYRADGDVVPTSGDAAIPGQIHYFDPQWKPQGSNKPYASSMMDHVANGHNIPLLNTYLQGLNTKNPALGVLKAAGIQDENTVKTLKDGGTRPAEKRMDARVVYGGSYSTANDPRLVTEGGRDNLLLLQKAATLVKKTPLSFHDVLTQELPANTLLEHLTTLAKGSASYQAFVTAALKMMGLQDKTYAPITLKVTEKDRNMAKDMAMKLPTSVQVPVQELQIQVSPEDLVNRKFTRLKAIWTSVRG
ncbi:hypothetical protein [Deinococcus multiflagellatus]|uniref:Fungal lipase-like domain-containing protein n=1 Tax=Deinococcus multiflagellatus TaxID=1656887 RepID=A0ABW1ZQW7_9DEIO|nr:hypothetical protein [Deinococcus multiflagellatus]MBZ9715377.1 hypothetical protein [Deinococcus multiflagellatus]